MIVFPDHPCVSEADLPDAFAFSEFHPFIKGVFSQWHPTPFDADALHFTCAEQYMMAAKASLFNDAETFEKIMQTDDPALQKALGARVSPFDQETWAHWRYHIVYAGNRAKFLQNAGAARRLGNTAPTMLVEANPRDWNWGNGLHLDDPNNQDPSMWRGANFLGRILTMLRDEVRGAQE